MSRLKDLLLTEPKRTLAVAESLTGGQLQARIASESGASGFFAGGVTAYNLEQKVALLKVNREAAAAVDCVSDDIARQMARGAAELFGADFAAATTGYAEPPAPDRAAYAHWALARREPDGSWICRSGRIVCPGLARVAVQEAVAATVYAELTAFVAEARG